MQKVSRWRLATHIARQLSEGTPSSSLAKQIAAYLIVNKQTKQVDLLLQDVNGVMAKEYGVVLAQVVSARALSSEVKQALVDYVSSAESAKTVELSESIDEDLIGGVVVRTPGAIFDSSIRTQLRHLKSIKETRSK